MTSTYTRLLRLLRELLKKEKHPTPLLRAAAHERAHQLLAMRRRSRHMSSPPTQPQTVVKLMSR